MDTLSIRSFYETNIYGKWRTGEYVSFQIHKTGRRMMAAEKSNAYMQNLRLSTTDDSIDVEIAVKSQGKESSFIIRAYLPENATAPTPYIVCMHPVEPKEYILSRGCAVLYMDTSMIAQDNNLHKGCFYDLYPYTSDAESQTGVLMAWAWGASKILDAVYNGLAGELNLDPDYSMITGVSRWGKATAVCAAFENRFRISIPVCSGAGGLALWAYQSEGRSYDLRMCGGPSDYTYSKNEPLECLQSESEQGWFNDRFLSYKNYTDIPVDQYMLPVLAASGDRKYFIIAAWMGEDWVNAPAMWECYQKALALYTEMGLQDHLKAHFHKEGHALLEEDVEFIFHELSL